MMTNDTTSTFPAKRPARKRVATLAILLALIAGACPSIGSAAPTPIPGGANQIAGISGSLASTFFNGKLRFRKFVLRNSTPAEATPDAGGTALTLTYLVLDGMSRTAYGNVSASIVDADGVVIGSHTVGVYGAYYSMAPGAAARGLLYFKLPPDFVPVKILLISGDGPALRINLKPSDLPKPAPSPAASTSPAP
jgi:hypothetical protein